MAKPGFSKEPGLVFCRIALHIFLILPLYFFTEL